MAARASTLGTWRWVGLDYEAEGGVKSYLGQVAAGIRRDTSLARLKFLFGANYAANYINWLRRKSNDPAHIARFGAIERRIKHPFGFKPRSERAARFLERDFHFQAAMLPRILLEGFREELENQPVYYDPYVKGFRHEGRPEETDHPFLYMDSHQLFQNPRFLEICTSPDLIAFCKEVLGPSAALSWAWSWISRPTALPYQNQNWHRDSSEPLNFIRVFVPLQAVEGLEDGPTELIPGTSGLRRFFEPRRFHDHELDELKRDMGAGFALCEAGDVYFANTFALHRGTPPMRQRGMLSLLVSLSPSHRTPAIRKLKMAELPQHVRPAVARNRRFFRFLVD